jgi:membrane protein
MQTKTPELRLRSQWLEIVKRTLHEVEADNCLGLAAQVAFFFVLALFPALLFLIALLSLLPVQEAVVEVFSIATSLMPIDVASFLREQFDQITHADRIGLLTIGIAGAIWSSSAAMLAIIDALNRILDVVEWRPWWKRQLVAIALTILLALFVLLVLSFISIGPRLFAHIAIWLGIDSDAAVVWQLLRWPLMVLFAVLGVNLVYYFAPNRRSRWMSITPGALLATALWIGTSFGFKLYVFTQADYIATYGAIEGMIATMLWFYLCGLAILVGAELNGVLSLRR